MNERVQVLTSGQPAYPALLKETPDPPKVLYYIGDIGMLRSRCAAVIGSRTSTAYGRNTARSIGKCLARHGVTVVSGMAAGIDTCAHEGALAGRGKTAAVLGCGPDICYPASNRELMEVIGQRGLLLSEYPPGTSALAFHFPRRNRIISGLCELTVVVQARVKSGALITAEMAADQGRLLCAVPGNIDSQYHMGTNQLIRDGVVPLTCVEDVLMLLGIDRTGAESAARQLSQTEYRVYSILKEQGELPAEEICRQMEQHPSYVLPILSALELKGFITCAAGKFFLANP